jgi:PilZ domain
VTTHSEFVWVITIAVFVAVVLIYILGVYIIETVRPILKPEKDARRVVDRRRSQRFEVRLPVLVYGHQTDAEPFCADATVLQVSTHGGLLTLTTNVRVGQVLLLESGGAEPLRRSCSVARLGTSTGGTMEVAVKFVRPVPEAWLTHARRD